MATACTSSTCVPVRNFGASASVSAHHVHSFSWRTQLAPPLPGFHRRRVIGHSHRTTSFIVSAKLPKLPSKHYLVEKVSGAELNKLLGPDREKSVVVDFYATWCGPCILLAQELEMLALEFGHKVKFVKVDTDEEYDLAHKMQVRGLPTVLFVSKDTEKDALRTEGILPRDVFRDIIQKNLL